MKPSPLALVLVPAALSSLLWLGCGSTPAGDGVVVAPEGSARPYGPPPAEAAGPVAPVVAPVAEATPAPPPPAPDPPGPPRASIRDPRRAASRALGLVQAEIAGLENLLRATPPTAPDAVQITRRLAEDNVELARIDPSLAATAEQQAIRYYKLIQATYPSYPQADEVGYFLGYELERAGDAASARRAYFEVIQKYPASRFVPYAYFAFGEMFLAEADQDPSRLELALQAFTKVAQFPTADLAPEAILRNARIHERRGEKAAASADYHRLHNAYASSPAASKAP